MASDSLIIPSQKLKERALMIGSFLASLPSHLQARAVPRRMRLFWRLHQPPSTCHQSFVCLDHTSKWIHTQSSMSGENKWLL